jgi:ATP-binding cassette subfamily F protein 3
MFQLREISKSFGGRLLFADVSWQVQGRDRVGLVGDNGTGKSTLLKLLAGLESPDSGQIQQTKEATLGYLPQDCLVYSGRSLHAEVRAAREDLLTMERSIRQLEIDIAAGDQTVLDRYASLQDEFRQKGGYELDAEIGRVLAGLGFVESDWQKDCAHFSGGWQMRIALARLLLKRPNLLLLDEPTNHLDLPAREWLETYLLEYPYSVLIVSHDRHFLDRVTTRTVEIWNSVLHDFNGNYSAYLVARKQRIETLRAAKVKQDQEIEKIESFISRFRAKADKAALVQSRVKQLDKIVRIELPVETKSVAFTFPIPPKAGRLAMELSEIRHSYGPLTVLDGVDLSIERGERIALVGANGAGKSTLMRIVSGVETAQAGTREEGHNLKLAYFAQNQAETLSLDKTVLEEITSVAPFDMVPKVRNILGSFLFRGDDVYKKVSVLSGGERNRLALAILLLRPANLLLLDEPTNHLDMASKDVLLEALKRYSGTLMFVSHDRYFVDALSSRVVEINNGKTLSCPGHYGDFLQFKKSVGDDSHSSDRVEQRQEKVVKQESVSSQSDHAVRKDEKREARRRQRELETVENHIARLEEKQSALEVKMSDPLVAGDHGQLAPLSKEHTENGRELEELYSRWEELGLL